MPTVALHLTRTISGAQRTLELPSYPVKYHRHLADGRVAEVTLDWPALVKLLGALNDAPDATRALGLGRALRAALLPSGWEHEEASLVEALTGGEATLVIRTNADELYALPWEAMPLGLNGPPLAEVPKLTVLYHEPGVSTPLAPDGQPRAALLAWSAGEKKVPYERVAEALGPTRTFAEPSLDQLVEALRIGEHDALVLLAHGGRTESGVALRWGDERVTPAQLVAALRGLPLLPAQVVVLACRAGAERAESLGFGGFGLELHRLGVAFVWASRWNLSFEGAVALAKGLRGGELRSGLRAGEVDGLGVVAFGSGATVTKTSRRALSAYRAEVRKRVDAMPWLSRQLGLSRSLTEVCVSVEVDEQRDYAAPSQTDRADHVPLSDVIGAVGARWVMLGDPGSGKSTLLRRLAWDLTQRGDWLPVLLHAGELAAHDDLPSAVKAVWGKGAAEAVAAWPEARLLVLVDGLDEVGDPRAVQRAMLARAHDIGEATMIVAGRPEGYPEPWAGFGVLQIQPLADTEQEKLLVNLGVPPALIAAQLPRLRRDPRLREIVARPLLLTLAALVLIQDGMLPDKRVQLYERAVECLLHRGELNPSAPLDVVRAPDDTLAALVALAPSLLGMGPGPWPRAACVEALRTDAAIVRRLAHTWPGDTARSFLEESTRTVGILVPQDRGRKYAFAHRTFGEYLASCALVNDRARQKEVARNWTAAPAQWAEVLALMVAQLPPERADNIIDQLVNAGDAARPLLMRVLASAEGLRPETVRGVLKLEVGWQMQQLQARQKVIEEIPALVKDLAVAVGLLEQVARNTTCGHDLFWVREVLRRIERSEVKGEVLDGSVEDAKRAAKGAADNVLSHLSTEKRAQLLALLQPWWRPIPAGSFDMGSNDYPDEKPIHRVTFTSGFHMLGVPVTWAMYRLFDPGHDVARLDFGSKLPPNAQDEVPVYNVSWFASVMFAEWAGARLPLEPEWEYTCRAGTKTRFWSGDKDEDLARVGWTVQNSDMRPHPVAQKPKNAWGLHDVHGNVWEWCAFDRRAYARRADGLNVDPLRLNFAIGGGPPELAKTANRGASRVLRGGSWNYTPRLARSAFRDGITPSLTNSNVGFRLLMCPPDPP